MLTIVVAVEDEGEPADRAAREIARQLRASGDVVTAVQVQQAGPSDARGLVDVIGVISVTLVSQGAIAMLLDVIKQRLLARKGRRIKLRVGDVEFEYQSDDMTDGEFAGAVAQFQKLLAGAQTK